MANEEQGGAVGEFHAQDGAIAAGKGAVAVGKEGIYVGGGVGGDVLGAGAKKITISEELSYQVYGLPNPYLGLRSFTYEDRAAFAGREAAARQALDKLTDPANPLNLLFVTGASGSGKSSFVQAGLLPRLEEHYEKRYKQVRHAVFRPSTAPLALLGDALEQLGLAGISAERLSEFSAEDFSHYLRKATPEKQVNLLVVDQFEESFTQSAKEQRERLFMFLAKLGSFAETRTLVIATLRADYLDELFKEQALWQAAKLGIELRAMREDELKQAIQQPLQAAGERDGRYKEKRFEPGLLDKLAQDAAQDSAYLPLLHVTLHELWKGGELKLERYGELTDAIRQRAEIVYGFEDYDAAAPEKGRPEADQAEILKIFTDLVEVSLGEGPRRDVRRRRLKSELVGDSIQRRGLVDSLVGARLLSASTELRGEYQVEVVDIIHETLIANWGRLSQVVADRRQNLQRRTRFEQALSEWQANEGKEDYLLSGVRLAEGRELELAGDIGLRDEKAAQFLHSSIAKVEASKAKAEADQRRRTKIAWAVALGLAILAGIAILAAVYAGMQTRQLGIEVATSTARLKAAINAQGTAEAQKATSDALRYTAEAAEATAVAEQNRTRSRELADIAISQIARPELAVLISLEAFQAWDTFQAGDSLRRSVAAFSPTRWILTGHKGGVNTAAFSPDGKRIVTASEDNTVRLWDVKSFKELDVFYKHEGGVNSAAFSPDGKLIVTAGHDGTAWLWKAERWAEPAALSGHGSVVNSAVFSPDGERVVTASDDRTARLWDVKSKQELIVLRGHKGQIFGATFSADGKKVVTASADSTARLWNVESGALLAELSGHEGWVFSAVFSPDGKRVATASQDGTARLWDAESGAELMVLRGHRDWVISAAFSPDSNRVVTASYDSTARIWDVDDGVMLAILSGHQGYVISAAFSPDGERVLTASYDGTARLWNAESSASLAVLRGHENWINSAVFSMDGRQVVTASDDGTARIYLVYLDDLVAQASQRVTRQLTCEERVLYLSEEQFCLTATGDVSP